MKKLLDSVMLSSDADLPRFCELIEKEIEQGRQME
jgi:hypothetical protein